MRLIDYSIHALLENGAAFESALKTADPESRSWKPEPGKWCLTEVVCHLYDEEREDFRARLQSVLESPEKDFPPIDPAGWVKSRNYIQSDFDKTLEKFLAERARSITWLKSLKNPDWGNTYQHPKIGPMSAKMILANWVAHDHLHLRQIIRLKYGYLKFISGESLLYAGEW